MLTLKLYALFLVSFVLRTSAVTRQPYGALMCKDLGQYLTNTTDLVKYDPLHLSCKIAVPVPVPKVTLWSNSESIGMFCGLSFRCVPLPPTIVVAAPGLDITIAENLMKEGDSIKADKCKKRMAVASMNMDILRERVSCMSGTLEDLQSGKRVLVTQSLQLKTESINCRDSVNGVTPLMQASVHHDIFDKLLGLGADLSMTTIGKDLSVLHFACLVPSPTIYAVKKLVELGLDIEQRTEKEIGSTPFLLSVIHKKFEVMKYLISVGCKVDVVTEDKQNALHLAAICSMIHVGPGSNDIMDFLLTLHHRIGLHSKDKEGHTPLDYAEGMDLRFPQKMRELMN